MSKNKDVSDRVGKQAPMNKIRWNQQNAQQQLFASLENKEAQYNQVEKKCNILALEIE